MITSSHNPAQWNGVKYKAWLADRAAGDHCEIESYLGAAGAEGGSPAAIEEVDFIGPYMAAIEKFADLDLIAKSGLKFGIDSMYGRGGS
jgi:phosphomannomutase